MPRVSCGRAGSTPRDRYKYLTQGSAGSCEIRGQRVHIFCPLFLRPWGDRLLAPRCIYMMGAFRTPNRRQLCMGEGCSPAPEFCKKGVPFVARLANMGDTGLLVSGSFRKGPLQGAFEGDFLSPEFHAKKSKSVSKTTCRAKICLVREKKN